MRNLKRRNNIKKIILTALLSMLCGVVMASPTNNQLVLITNDSVTGLSFSETAEYVTPGEATGEVTVDGNNTAEIIINFPCNRNNSEACANYFAHKLGNDSSGDNCICTIGYTKFPSELNFVIVGNLTVITAEGKSDIPVVLAQGNTQDDNQNWWIGAATSWAYESNMGVSVNYLKINGYYIKNIVSVDNHAIRYQNMSYLENHSSQVFCVQGFY